MRVANLKKWKVVLGISILLVGLAGNTTMTFAAEKSVNTTGKVIFTQGNEPVNPVDPEEPENPVDPVNPVDPTEGPLSVDYASSFNFGEQKVTGTSKVYHADLDKFKDNDGNIVERTNFVQVSDNRGTAGGWQLSVTQGKQFTGANAEELKGAELSLNNVTAVTPGSGTAPAVGTSVTLTPGSASILMTAAKDTGTGTWLARFGQNSENGKTSVQLKVPGAAAKATNYSTDLTWTLTDSPA